MHAGLHKDAECCISQRKFLSYVRRVNSKFVFYKFPNSRSSDNSLPWHTPLTM